METVIPHIESNEYENMFELLLGNNNHKLPGGLNSYTKNNINNVAYDTYIYNDDLLVWEGELDLTVSEKGLKDISLKLDTILNIVHKSKSKILISFNKGGTIVGLDFKKNIVRDGKTKKLINI